MKKNIYSKEDARHMLCRYHNLDGAEMLSGEKGVEKIMKRIHSIQYDPLNPVARNADLVLQARINEYTESVLYSLLYEKHKLVDGFDKEMCIYDAKDFSAFQYIRNEHEKHVVSMLEYRNQSAALSILDDVYNFVKEHGITGTKDISLGDVREESRWGHKKLSSAALDYLFNKGVLYVVDRRGTQKYFDLTERVFHDNNLQDKMKIEDFLEWYIERRIQSVGLLWNRDGGAWQGHFLGDDAIRGPILRTLLEKNRLIEIQVDGIEEPFYISKKSLKYMKYQTSNDYARFIAPLDNMIWDRKMTEELFHFVYRWEVYTPIAKRKYGYYVLPVLYNDRFIARFEAIPVKQAGAFVIKNWWWEPGIVPHGHMIDIITQEMERFAKFLNISNSPDNIKKLKE